MKTVGLFLTLVAFASACCHDDTCSCEPNCWEQCFMNPPTNQEGRLAYMKIYHMALGIRNLYAPCFKPHGTAYMMDSDVPISTAIGVSAASVFSYQRNLASIVAMTQPVGDGCNPFCASKFYRNFAWYAHSWPCQDRCEMYDFFNSGSMASFSSSPANSNQPSWVGGGEILADLCFDRDNLNGHECMNCTKNELLLAFTNSPMYWTPPSERCGVDFYCAAIGTDPSATYDNMASWTSSGPVYHMPADSTYINAAARINRCIHDSCCNKQLPNTWWTQGFGKRKFGFSAAAQDAQDSFFYTDPQAEKRVKTFRGTQAAFEKVVDKAVNSGVSFAATPSRG